MVTSRWQEWRHHGGRSGDITVVGVVTPVVGVAASTVAVNTVVGVAVSTVAVMVTTRW